MPWIKEENCVGCGICVENCPADAISIYDDKAVIDMKKCIRCGVCHDVCPQDAVRHDAEKIPAEIQANIDWVYDLMKYFKTEEERAGFITRIKKHFNKERTIAEKTIEKIDEIEL